MAYKFNPITGSLDLSGGETPSGDPNQFATYNGSGNLISNPSFQVDTTSGGMYTSLTEEPDGNAGNFPVNSVNVSLNPQQNSPSETWTVQNNQVTLDPDSTGFQIGTGGEAVMMDINSVVHNGTSDIGSVNFERNSFSIGNGTDPIDVNGVTFTTAFGQINDNVNLSGPIQGYGLTFNISANASMDNTEYVQGFYDTCNVAIPIPGWNSFAAGPAIAEITPNRNYNGVSLNPTIDNFDGNAGFFGLAVNGNLGTFGTGTYYGLNVNPTIDLTQSAIGVSVTMDNVTVGAGVAASLVIQDLTITANQVGTAANGVTFEYIGGGTAGSEIVSNIGLAFTVQLEDGVSTATQVKAALDGYATFTVNASAVISGVGGNAQVIQAATPLAGGVDAGVKKAASFDGDVEITGSLSFGGALSIGKLSAFASQAVVDGGGAPGSVHSLISSPTVPDNTILANGDTFGINTACIVDIGDNSTVTTGFLGMAALGLPAVVQLGINSTVDKVSGGLLAISLDNTAGAGSSIDVVDLCRVIAIPNGITAVNNLIGYRMDLPFGDPGTDTWGVYITPETHNFMAGALKIGGTDTEANDSVALEIESTTKAFLNARMTTVQRDALTAINGMQIYNSTTDKLQVYAAGAWVDLH